jgi:hypothetical protein
MKAAGEYLQQWGFTYEARIFGNLEYFPNGEYSRFEGTKEIRFRFLENYTHYMILENDKIIFANEYIDLKELKIITKT